MSVFGDDCCSYICFLVLQVPKNSCPKNCGVDSRAAKDEADVATNDNDLMKKSRCVQIPTLLISQSLFICLCVYIYIKQI